MDWLSEDEKALAAERLQVEGSKGHDSAMTWEDAKATLLDWRLWGHYIVYFGISVPFSSLSFFTPSITAGLGYKDLQAQLMTVPPVSLNSYITRSWRRGVILGRERRTKPLSETTANTRNPVRGSIWYTPKFPYSPSETVS